jgi:hypothetical protein
LMHLERVLFQSGVQSTEMGDIILYSKW